MIDLVARVELLRGVPRTGLARLMERGRPRAFPAGSVLMQQGEPSDAMYVVVKGLVQVQRSHPQLSEAVVLAELGPAEVVGEMGVLDGEPRSATVVALEDTETLEVGAQALAVMLLDYPAVAGTLLRTLSRRVRSTDELTAAMAAPQREMAGRS